MPKPHVCVKKIITAGFLLSSLLFSPKASALDYEEIYIFGDSLSDTGRAFEWTDGASPPNPPYFNGRFSNGPVWAEYLAVDMGLSFNPDNNFAFGGATTGFDNIVYTGSSGLQQQIDSFTTTQTSVNPNALYIVWAGGNDYINYFFGGKPNPSEVVDNLSEAVSSLADSGSQNIMVFNMPNIGSFPVANYDPETSKIFEDFIQDHNSDLDNTLDRLSEELDPSVNLISFDVNSLYDRIIAEPTEFNLSNVTDYCISPDLSVVPVDVPEKSIKCLPEQFLFFDAFHPTTATHEVIGENALIRLNEANTTTNVSESSNLLGLLILSSTTVLFKLRFEKYRRKLLETS